MRRGQGSLEALLIMGAVLLIAAVVVLVANSVIATPRGAGDVAAEKAKCTLNDAELVGYTKEYDGTSATAPTAINWKTRKELEKQAKLNETIGSNPGTETCDLGDFTLFFNRTSIVYYLETDTSTKYVQYGEESGGGSGGSVSLTSTTGTNAIISLCDAEGSPSTNNARQIGTPGNLKMDLNFDFSSARPLAGEATIQLDYKSSDGTKSITFTTTSGSVGPTTNDPVDITTVDTSGNTVKVTLSTSTTNDLKICDETSDYPPKITIT